MYNILYRYIDFKTFSITVVSPPYIYFKIIAKLIDISLTMRLQTLLTVNFVYLYCPPPALPLVALGSINLRDKCLGQVRLSALKCSHRAWS